MAGTFLKTTLRNLYREKMYAIINIAGLSLAITCCLILGLYLRNELTYDQHNTKYRQIYRVVNEFNVNGKTETFARTSQLLGPMLTEGYDDIKGFVRIGTVSRKALFTHADKAYYWENTGFASKNFFQVFDHDFIYGDPETTKAGHWVAVSETFGRSQS